MKLFAFRVPVLWSDQWGDHVAWDLIAVSDNVCKNRITAEQYIPLHYHLLWYHPWYCSTFKVVETKSYGSLVVAWTKHGWAWVKPHHRETDIWDRDIKFDHFLKRKEKRIWKKKLEYK